MRGKKPFLTKEEFHQLYVVERRTDREIASIAGYKHYQSVYELRTHYGIKRINKWERYQIEPTQRQVSIMSGSLLGDASIEAKRFGSDGCNCCFTVKHAISQEEYLRWKYEQLKNLCLSEPKIVSQDRIRFRTRSHPFFSAWRREYYPRGKKQIGLGTLKKLDPLSLAVWFLDDGTNIDQGRTLRFATCGFTYKEHELFSAVLKNRFGLDTAISEYSGYLFLRIAVPSRRKFLDIISPHVPKCMEYKINDTRLR